MKKFKGLLLLLLSFSVVNAQPFASWTKTELGLNNGLVERTIKLPNTKGAFTTSTY